MEKKKKTVGVLLNADRVGKVKKIVSGGAVNANLSLCAKAEALDSSKTGSGCPHHHQVGFIKLSSSAAESELFVCRRSPWC